MVCQPAHTGRIAFQEMSKAVLKKSIPIRQVGYFTFVTNLTGISGNQLGGFDDLLALMFIERLNS